MTPSDKSSATSVHWDDFSHGFEILPRFLPVYSTAQKGILLKESTRYSKPVTVCNCRPNRNLGLKSTPRRASTAGVDTPRDCGAQSPHFYPTRVHRIAGQTPRKGVWFPPPWSWFQLSALILAIPRYLSNENFGTMRGIVQC